MGRTNSESKGSEQFLVWPFLVVVVGVQKFVEHISVFLGRDGSPKSKKDIARRWMERLVMFFILLR